MTKVLTVTADQLEAIAFAADRPIHLGAHEADVEVEGVLYVARIAPVGGAA